MIFFSATIKFFRFHFRSVTVVALILWLITVAALSLLPFSSVAFLAPSISDDVTHFIAYMVGGLLAGLCFRKLKVSWVVIAGIGTLIEFGQTWVGTGRSSELGEGIANGLGSLLGVAIALALKRWVERFEQRH